MNEVAEGSPTSDVPEFNRTPVGRSDDKQSGGSMNYPVHGIDVSSKTRNGLPSLYAPDNGSPVSRTRHKTTAVWRKNEGAYLYCVALFSKALGSQSIRQPLNHYIQIVPSIVARSFLSGDATNEAVTNV